MLRSSILGFCTQTLFFLITTKNTSATAVNRTIDDRYGDSVTGERPVFLPTTRGIWEGQDCAGCKVRPDIEEAFNGTWNAATFRQGKNGSGQISFALKFKGTAIYVYLITGNQIEQGVTTLTECNITLDGRHANFYRRAPDETTVINYNVLAFSSTNLPNTDHTLNVSTGGVDHHVFLNFDYAIYTFDDDVQSPPPFPQATPKGSPPLPHTSSRTINSATTHMSPGSIIQGSTSRLVGNHNEASGIPLITSQSSSMAPTMVPASDGGKTSLGTILGGTIGGLALAFAVILSMWVWLKRKKEQWTIGSGSSFIQHPISPQTESLHNLRTSSLNESTSSRPGSISGLSENYNITKQRISPDEPEISQYGYTKGKLEYGLAEEKHYSGLTHVSAAPTDTDVLRAWQIDIGSRIKDAEPRLKAAVIEP